MGANYKGMASNYVSSDGLAFPMQAHIVTAQEWARRDHPCLREGEQAGNEGDASVPSPHSPSPAPTGREALPKRDHTIAICDKAFGQPSLLFLARLAICCTCSRCSHVAEEEVTGPFLMIMLVVGTALAHPGADEASARRRRTSHVMHG